MTLCFPPTDSLSLFLFLLNISLYQSYFYLYVSVSLSALNLYLSVHLCPYPFVLLVRSFGHFVPVHYLLNISLGRSTADTCLLSALTLSLRLCFSVSLYLTCRFATPDSLSLSLFLLDISLCQCYFYLYGSVSLSVLNLYLSVYLCPSPYLLNISLGRSTADTCLLSAMTLSLCLCFSVSLYLTCCFAPPDSLYLFLFLLNISLCQCYFYLYGSVSLFVLNLYLSIYLCPSPFDLLLRSYEQFVPVPCLLSISLGRSTADTCLYPCSAAGRPRSNLPEPNKRIIF